MASGLGSPDGAAFFAGLCPPKFDARRVPSSSRRRARPGQRARQRDRDAARHERRPAHQRARQRHRHQRRRQGPSAHRRRPFECDDERQRELHRRDRRERRRAVQRLGQCAGSVDVVVNYESQSIGNDHSSHVGRQGHHEGPRSRDDREVDSDSWAASNSSCAHRRPTAASRSRRTSTPSTGAKWISLATRATSIVVAQLWRRASRTASRCVRSTRTGRARRRPRSQSSRESNTHDLIGRSLTRVQKYVTPRLPMGSARRIGLVPKRTRVKLRRVVLLATVVLASITLAASGSRGATSLAAPAGLPLYQFVDSGTGPAAVERGLARGFDRSHHHDRRAPRRERRDRRRAGVPNQPRPTRALHPDQRRRDDLDEPVDAAEQPPRAERRSRYRSSIPRATSTCSTSTTCARDPAQPERSRHPVVAPPARSRPRGDPTSRPTSRPSVARPRPTDWRASW
jgi:hypothetical protein